MRFIACLLVISALWAGELPKSWIDPDTGHRVVRLTEEPGSASLYFNQNGYTADGKKLVYTTPDGISVFDLATHKAKPVVKGRVRAHRSPAARRSASTTRDGAVFSTDVDTGETRKIARSAAARLHLDRQRRRDAARRHVHRRRRAGLRRQSRPAAAGAPARSAAKQGADDGGALGRAPARWRLFTIERRRPARSKIIHRATTG